MACYPTWAEIDLSALRNNIREIRRVTDPGAEVMAVVKANAYGHGAVRVSGVVLENGATRLAVARLSEGAELRRAGIKAPILILGYTPVDMIDEIAEYGLQQTVHDCGYALSLNNRAAMRGVRVPVHIKIDTGMGRLGIVAGSASAMNDIRAIAALPNLEPAGVYTHFATADSADKTFTMRQMERFIKIIDALRKEGVEFPLRHCANSAAVIDMPQNCMNMVRAGISLYGLYPSGEVNVKRVRLRPVMSFKTRVAQVKTVPPGFPVSYGCTYVTERETVIATLPVGYADGFSRLLSNKGVVLVRGERAPVVGRVCMDQCMIDVGGIPGVQADDEVVLFGSQGGCVLAVEEVAGLIGTINYEVVCMVNERVPRIYIEREI
ncbi:MAG: alanine racemase [Bacillota bacterium]